MLLTPTVRLQTSTPADLLSLTEAKDHLRILHNEEDTLIEALVKAAAKWIESRTGRALASRTRTNRYREFPTGEIIELDFPPLISVQSLKYYDEDNTLTTMDAADYLVLVSDEFNGFIELVDGVSWPDTFTRPDAVEVNFTCGYAVVPETARQAARLLIGHWFTNRDDVVTGTISTSLDKAVDSLCRSLHTGKFAYAASG